MSNCAFNYCGSKSDYTELHAIDEPVVDLFGGGGGLWSNVKSDTIWVNDVNDELINFQKLVHSMSDEQFEMLISKLYERTGEVNTREWYEAMRAKLNETRNPILFMCALSCCTNNMIRYNKSGGFNQTWGKRKFNPNMEKKLRAFRERIRNKKIDFLIGDFTNVPVMNDAVYFADPPYYITSAGYNTAWGEDNEYALYDYLSKVRFVMTNFITRGELENDILRHQIVKHGWMFRELRSGQMRAQRNKGDSYSEIIVTNDKKLYDLIQ